MQFHLLSQMYNLQSVKTKEMERGNPSCRPSCRHMETIKDHQILNWEWSKYFSSNRIFLMLMVCTSTQGMCACEHILYTITVNIERILFCVYFQFAQQCQSKNPMEPERWLIVHTGIGCLRVPVSTVLNCCLKNYTMLWNINLPTIV